MIRWQVQVLRGTSAQTTIIIVDGPSNTRDLFEELMLEGYYPISAMRVVRWP